MKRKKNLYRKLRFFARNRLFPAVSELKALHPEPGKGRILIYHGIHTHAPETINSRFIDIARFESQIAYFKEHFHILPLEDYFQGRLRQDRFNIAITFDDGYRNNLTQALPILERYEAPAFFFIPSSDKGRYAWLWMDALDIAASLYPGRVKVFRKKYYIKQRGFLGRPSLRDICMATSFHNIDEIIHFVTGKAPFAHLEEMKPFWERLSKEEIEKLSRSPFAQIGAHGHYHTNLTAIDFEDARDELRESKAILGSITGKKINTLAWPFGLYTRKLAEYAHSIGFTHQYGVMNTLPENPGLMYMRDRMVIHPRLPLPQLVNAILKGNYF